MPVRSLSCSRLATAKIDKPHTHTQKLKMKRWCKRYSKIGNSKLAMPLSRGRLLLGPKKL